MPTPDDAHLARLGGFPDRVIFIVGMHRTGTTLLHRSLVSMADLDFVSLYEVCEFPRLLDQRIRGDRDAAVAALEARLAPSGGVRGIDHLPVGALEPEEYGGVLRRSCVGLDRCRPYSNPDLEPLRLLARKKAFLADRPRPLILKNPIDCYDGVFRLAEAIPGATFVLLHRHPLPTIDSNVRSWRRLLEAPNAWFAEIDRGYRVLLRMPELLESHRRSYGSDDDLRTLFVRIRTGMMHALEVEKRLPANRVVQIRFEDLCAAPETELTRLLDALGLDQVRPLEETVAAPRSRGGGAALNRIHDELLESWRPWLRRHGYPDRPES